MLRSRRIGAMRDVELYRALLGLTPPWTVADVEVDMKGQRVVVRVEAGPGPYPCPECGTAGRRYDSKPRRWRHLDTMQFTTWIEAEVPRVECGRHGVKQVRVPWAEPGSQFTALFERLAIDLLQECSDRGWIEFATRRCLRTWASTTRPRGRGICGSFAGGSSTSIASSVAGTLPPSASRMSMPTWWRAGGRARPAARSAASWGR